MEKKIYEECITRLSSAEAIAYITTATHEALKHQAWYEGQPDNAIEKENVITYPFDCPALFYQFSETKYENSKPNFQEANGELTLHVAQSKYVDGIELAENHAAYKKLLEYAGLMIDLLNGYKLPCSARLVLARHERDHVNRPLMIDKITFAWSGRRKKPAGVPA